MERTWTEDMGELSGFGGSYEAACRAMVLAGIEWLDAHPQADPHYCGFKNVFGLVSEENGDAKALTAAIMEAKVTTEDGKETEARAEATGAMHHVAVLNVLAYKRLGWEEYCKQRRALEQDEARSAETRGPRTPPSREKLDE